MRANTEIIKDATMILAGLFFYATAMFWLFSKLTTEYSLNLM